MITNVLNIRSKRTGYAAIAVFTTLFMALPSIVPFLIAHASAENITTRSIQVSDSTPLATGVTYKLTFTPETTGALSAVIDFCANSPLIGSACTTPDSFTAAGATLAGAAPTDYPTGWSISGTPTANHIVLTGTDLLTSERTFTFAGITNPASPTINAGSSNTYFARVTTYTNASPTAAGYTGPTVVGTVLDQGSVALSVATELNVSAAVLETLVFCVSKAEPEAACAGTSDPNLVLGHGTPAALDETDTDEDDAYMQISSNASAGVNVYMKNSNSCGGLSRNGGSSCDIAPRGAANAAIDAGNAFFGLQVADGEAVVGAPTATGSITPAAPYAGSGFAMDNTTLGNTVSGTYGSLIAQTGQPLSNMNSKLTFAASASGTTPAGMYKARMILVAVGTY